jgi:DNA adenine methylase
MVYVGSKNRIAKQLLEVILKDRKPDQYYIEPFCGGCNVIDKVTGPRIANDGNKYLIALLQAMLNGWIPPADVTKEEYYDIRANKDNYPDYLVGFAGFCCSFSSKWMGGYAPNNYYNKEKTGKEYIHHYITRKTNNILKQLQNLKGIEFSSMSYDEIIFPPNSIIYCDAPYTTTIKEKVYKDKFDFDKYYNWLRKISKEHTVYISEYEMPDDFECVTEINIGSSFQNQNKEKTEKLFKLK